MSEPTTCPGCGSAKLDEFNRKYRCGSVGPYAGERIPLERTEACHDLEELRREYKFADEHANTLVAAAEQFRDEVLHGIDQFDNDQTNAVLNLFDSVVGCKL